MIQTRPIFSCGIAVLLALSLLGCGSSTSRSASIEADAITQAILATNPDGVVAGQAMAEITLPPCRNEDGQAWTAPIYYSLYQSSAGTLPDWLAFDGFSRILGLADGVAVVPDSLAEALTMTYGCAGAGIQTFTIEFVLNDADGDGTIDA